MGLKFYCFSPYVLKWSVNHISVLNKGVFILNKNHTTPLSGRRAPQAKHPSLTVPTMNTNKEHKTHHHWSQNLMIHSQTPISSKIFYLLLQWFSALRLFKFEQEIQENHASWPEGHQMFPTEWKTVQSSESTQCVDKVHVVISPWHRWVCLICPDFKVNVWALQPWSCQMSQQGVT